MVLIENIAELVHRAARAVKYSKHTIRASNPFAYFPLRYRMADRVMDMVNPYRKVCVECEYSVIWDVRMNPEMCEDCLYENSDDAYREYHDEVFGRPMNV